MHRVLLRLPGRAFYLKDVRTSLVLRPNAGATSAIAELTSLRRGVSTRSGMLPEITSVSCAQRQFNSQPCRATAAVDELHIQGHTPIQQAIQACCSSLGRKPGPAEATLVSVVPFVPFVQILGHA